MNFGIQLEPGVDNYVVMGNPVAHSRSPEIHHAFARQTGRRLRYQTLLVQPGCFPEALAAFQAAGGRGANVTVPFKYDAFAAVAHPTPRAQRAGAVNTVWFDAAGEAHGDTTDGVGLVRDLARNGVRIEGAAILVLGAGGAVSGVLGDLADLSPSGLVLANRTLRRAAELAERFAGAGVPVEALPYEALAGRRFDLVINGTSLSLEGRCPPLPEGILAEGACCYDMVYGQGQTPFLQWGAAQGAAKRLEGTGMLVEQAAESFAIWHGVRPDPVPVIALLRGEGNGA